MIAMSSDRVAASRASRVQSAKAWAPDAMRPEKVVSFAADSSICWGRGSHCVANAIIDSRVTSWRP